ncbi:MAG TPA: DUF4332 domain-containing protein [Pirellulaceae bacterium]|jgi:hypothetical protein|nr:DUF4332 domain-containing protein [Pirellulaceae bacterium]
MNLLHRVLDAAYCTSSHHRMALDALPLMAGPEAFLRRNVCYFWHEAYLKGSKAPDDEFKDFRNHVLHVEENFWGGAPQAAREWFDRTVEDLKRENWDQAAFSAGVLSHYVTDPFQPFHTGSSDKETHYHRAVEWSVAKSFPALRDRIESSGGYPKVDLPSGRDWLEETILAGAQRAHQDYSLPFERFDLERGSATPEEGLDETLSASFAALIAQATATFAAILDRAWEESRAIPPDVNLSLPGLLATLKMPVAWVVKKLVETEEQRTVLAIYEEVRRTGKLTRYLPEECHAIDMVHAQERLAAMPLSRFAERRLQKSKDESAKKTPAPQRVTQAQPAPQARPERAPVTEMREAVASSAETPAARVERAPQEAPAIERRAEVAAPARPVAESRPVVESKPRVTPPPAPAFDVSREATKVAAEKGPSVASGLMAKLAAANPFASKSAEGANKAPAANVTSKAEPQPSRPAEAARPEALVSKPSVAAQKPEERSQAKDEPRVMPMRAMSPPERKPAGETSKAAASGETRPQASKPSERRYYLELDAPIVDAPSIGPKTAKRMEQVGVRTVAEFLRASADQLAKKIDAEHLPAARLREFQLQTKLVLRIAGLRGHDAQFLVGAGYTEPDEIAASKAEELLADVLEFIETPEGERALRSGAKPDLAEVRGWIEGARRPRTLTANAA